MKKTILLEYIISRADKLKENDGRKALSANYFVLSLLQTIKDAVRSQIPDEINNANARAELILLRSTLSRRIDNNDAVIRDIMEFVSSPEYKPYMDELMFSKISYNAETKAKKQGEELLSVTHYLELILAEPSAAISKHIIDQEQTEDQSEDLFEDDEEEYQKETESNEPQRETDASGTRNLSGIINSTRRIQTKLLDCVFGQDQAVNTFVSGYFQAQLMSFSRRGSRKPQATFLFAGPPGVGKTFLAEKAAEALGLPYKRFDMSEYSDKEANLEFCGSDKVYKNGKPGNVTEFVANNPRCVLLFDEIEKSHINIIYLFLQILDAGRIRDNYTDEEVSFSDAVIIFTTNVGKNLYDDPTVKNLSALPRKRILKALASDVDPATQAPLFPAAICSRFASGNVVMFNHLEASNLFTIAKRELQNNAKSFETATGIEISIDDRIPSIIMLSEGGKADARTVKGRANSFFHEELYELFRLLSSDNVTQTVQDLSKINITVPTGELDGEIAAMFEDPDHFEVLIFADEATAKECTDRLDGRVTCYTADNIELARDILFNHDISIVICDVRCNMKDVGIEVLNAEDINSDGHDFMTYVLDKHSFPVYVIQRQENEISQEEFLSFASLGVKDVLTIRSDSHNFVDGVISECKVAYWHSNMLKLARENKALAYKTSQTISKNKDTADIRLFNFRLNLITDTEDSRSVLDNVSRPNLHFSDVIGAEDAKRELEYFVEYLKNPIKYMRRGVRSPKGVLLYGPPGTGKTLLAKAMAGESGVTFLKAEGNEFLKRYVGEGAQAVHSLFNAARKYAPSIVFIDEIDAIGKDRNLSADGSNGDVLTAFLTEMDGFNTDTSRPVFVLAATNYGVDAGQGKSLDAALLRRFDRRIYIDLPTKEERKRYLEMKLNKNNSVRLSPEQIDNIAMRSTGMSLAELESIFEMALRNAVRTENGVVGDEAFEEVFETFNSGEKKEWNPDTLIRTARHEAGHALICWMSGEKPSYLTIVARGDHGGYMQHANNEGKGLYTKAELLNRIRTSLGGRASEIVYYGVEDGISTGASGDLYSATKIAEQMLCNYGMDESVGLSYIGPDNASNQAIRDRVNSILSDELKGAISIINANKQAIDKMVEALMEKNHLKENEIDAIFGATVNMPNN